MSLDDFFDGIDKTITEKKEQKSIEEEQCEQRRAYFNEVITRIEPLAVEYASRLGEKGVRAEVSTSRGGILFKIFFKNGAQHHLSFYEVEKFNGYYSIVRHSTDDNGRRFTSTDGSHYSQTNWKDEIFLQKLESHIKDFFYYAERQGGL